LNLMEISSFKVFNNVLRKGGKEIVLAKEWFLVGIFIVKVLIMQKWTSIWTTFGPP
jgi:hypothetical protein